MADTNTWTVLLKDGRHVTLDGVQCPALESGDIFVRRDVAEGESEVIARFARSDVTGYFRADAVRTRKTRVDVTGA